MITRSTVLFIFICSNHKSLKGESAEYATSYALGNYISEKSAQKLYEVRAKIMRLITTTPAKRDSIRLRDFPLNRNLVHGPDFQFRGLRDGGLYLPAAQRYTGGFYHELLPSAREVLAGC